MSKRKRPATVLLTAKLYCVVIIDICSHFLILWIFFFFYDRGSCVLFHVLYPVCWSKMLECGMLERDIRTLRRRSAVFCKQLVVDELLIQSLQADDILTESMAESILVCEHWLFHSGPSDNKRSDCQQSKRQKDVYLPKPCMLDTCLNWDQEFFCW